MPTRNIQFEPWGWSLQRNHIGLEQTGTGRTVPNLDVFNLLRGQVRVTVGPDGPSASHMLRLSRSSSRWISCLSNPAPQSRHRTRSSRPCRSMTSLVPARWCRRSTFWVMEGDVARLLKSSQRQMIFVDCCVPDRRPPHHGSAPVAAARVFAGAKFLMLYGAIAQPLPGTVSIGGYTRGRAYAGTGQHDPIWVLLKKLQQL